MDIKDKLRDIITALPQDSHIVEILTSVHTELGELRAENNRLSIAHRELYDKLNRW